MPTIQAAEGAKATTKTLVWKGADRSKEAASPLHSRLIEPEHHGVSRTYHFHPDTGHALEVDETDAAIIMSGPDRAEFRVKTSGGDAEE